MMSHSYRNHHHRNPRARRQGERRGMTLVLLTVSMAVLLGCAALAADVGQLYVTRTKLQRAADAASLAGASCYFSDAGLMQSHDPLRELVVTHTQALSFQNQTYNSGTFLEEPDIHIGAHDFHNRTAALDTSGAHRYNAVEVTVRRERDSVNGPVPFFFAPLLGMRNGGVTATARAAMDDRVAGYRYELEDGYPIIPFTIEVGLNDALVQTGQDNFTYDNGVQQDHDGIREVVLYPWSSKTVTGGSGNFGLVDFEGGSTPAMDHLIRNGVTPDELETVLGTSNLVYNVNGSPHTYNVPGAPGMKSALNDALASRIGDVVAYFVHDQVQESGSHAIYRNVGMRFGRIMEVDLQSGTKRLVLQPVAHTSRAVIVSEDAPSSNGMVGRVVLVK